MQCSSHGSTVRKGVHNLQTSCSQTSKSDRGVAHHLMCCQADLDQESSQTHDATDKQTRHVPSGAQHRGGGDQSAAQRRWRPKSSTHEAATNKQHQASAHAHTAIWQRVTADSRGPICNAFPVTFLPILPEDLPKLGLRPGVEDLRGTGSSAWAHAHVQRCVFGEAEASMGLIHLFHRQRTHVVSSKMVGG